MMLILMILFVGCIFILLKEDQPCQCSNGKEVLRCNDCGQVIKDDYNYCPSCKTQLKKKCKNCGRMIDRNWRRCPYCE